MIDNPLAEPAAERRSTIVAAARLAETFLSPDCIGRRMVSLNFKYWWKLASDVMLTPACQAGRTLPQDTDCSESLPVPNGWIVPRRTKNVEQVLKEYTGLKGTLVLSEESGTRYIFSSGKDYYVWNCSCEDGWRLVDINNREELYGHLAKGKGLKGLKIELLPDFGNLEG